MLLLGDFRGTVDFGGGALVSVGASNANLFLLKLDVNGQHSWSKNLGIK
ncbi:Hypothetical protein A7982_07879 [Minicystis rosea]|nr:Hypothetical protein A7982_07879 [Minicystis rosea]